MLGISELGRRQFRLVHLQNGQVALCVSGHIPGLVGMVVIEVHRAGAAALQHVVVGEDIAIGTEDHARAHGGLLLSQLGHDRHHRGVHLLVDLLGGQLGAVVRLHFQHGPLSIGVAGNGDLLGCLVRLLFKIILELILPLRLPPGPKNCRGRQHGHQAAAAQEDPQPALGAAVPPVLLRLRPEPVQNAGRHHARRQRPGIGLHHFSCAALAVDLHHLGGLAAGTLF